jgi:rod shape-determining protein MreC
MSDLKWNDIIVALATPQGVGAIGVIRLSGKGSIELVDQLFISKKLVDQPANTLHVGLLMDDETFKVGVRLESTGTLGVVSGTGGSALELILLDSTSDLRVGQRVVARGSSNSQPFLPGVPVGVITEVNQTAGALTKSAVVKPFVDLNRISVVAVIVSKSKTDPRDALLPPSPRPTPTVTVFITPTPDLSPSVSDSNQ